MKRRTFLQAAMAILATAFSHMSLGLREMMAGFCSNAVRRRRAMILPPIPKWNKLTDDIDGGDFRRRSTDYERSLTPRDLVFPKAGQIWEAVRDCEAPVLMRFQPGGPLSPPMVRIGRGDKVRILTLDDQRPLQVKFRPLDSPEPDWTIELDDLPYQLFLRTAPTVPCPTDRTGYFSQLFRLVKDAA